MDRGAWWAIKSLGISKSLKKLSRHAMLRLLTSSLNPMNLLSVKLCRGRKHCPSFVITSQTAKVTTFHKAEKELYLCNMHITSITIIHYNCFTLFLVTAFILLVCLSSVQSLSRV